MALTQGQRAFLEELRELDELQQGTLAVSIKIGFARARKLEAQCIARGWVRTEPRADVWVRTMYLTTKGLRALQRSAR